MERAFYITKESKYYKDLNRYIEMTKNQKSQVFKFLEENNIQAEKYYVRGDGMCNCPFGEFDKDDIRLYIIPTENDLQTIGKQLCRVVNDNGLCQFRANSKISKKFAQYCVDNEVIINILELDLRDYLKSINWMGYSQRKFPWKDGYYLKVTSDLLKEDDNPEGFVPIKLSEFYKALEEFKIEKGIK